MTSTTFTRNGYTFISYAHHGQSKVCVQHPDGTAVDYTWMQRDETLPAFAERWLGPEAETGGPETELHEVSVTAHGSTPRRVEFVGRCSCGWVGQAQPSHVRAEGDGDDHRNAIPEGA